MTVLKVADPVTTEPTTKQSILVYLRKHHQATTQELSDHLGVSRQAIRRHLKDLETDGLILYQSVQGGMGRPQHVYQLSREGRDHFVDGYDQFATSLMGTLADTLGREQLQHILEQQWQRKGLEYRQKIGTGSLAERVQVLVQLREAEGYMADLLPADTGSTPAFLLSEYNCAIAQIAETFPSVCGHELSMFALALPDCHVERTHWMVNGEHRCGYLIQS